MVLTTRSVTCGSPSPPPRAGKSPPPPSGVPRLRCGENSGPCPGDGSSPSAPPAMARNVLPTSKSRFSVVGWIPAPRLLQICFRESGAPGKAGVSSRGNDRCGGDPALLGHRGRGPAPRRTGRPAAAPSAERSRFPERGAQRMRYPNEKIAGIHSARYLRPMEPATRAAAPVGAPAPGRAHRGTRLSPRRSAPPSTSPLPLMSSQHTHVRIMEQNADARSFPRLTLRHIHAVVRAFEAPAVAGAR